MTPEEIIDAYNVLSQNVQDNAATEAARIGNAQRSLGTLAARVASPSGQTSGLANYTYDRVMRPTVDSTARALAVQGLAAGLEMNLSNALRAAKNRYEDARNRATMGSGGGGGGGTTEKDEETEEQTDPAYEVQKHQQTVRESIDIMHERGDLSDEDYQAMIDALKDGDGGTYTPPEEQNPWGEGEKPWWWDIATNYWSR